MAFNEVKKSSLTPKNRKGVKDHEFTVYDPDFDDAENEDFVVYDTDFDDVEDDNDDEVEEDIEDYGFVVVEDDNDVENEVFTVYDPDFDDAEKGLVKTKKKSKKS